MERPNAISGTGSAIQLGDKVGVQPAHVNTRDARPSRGGRPSTGEPHDACADDDKIDPVVAHSY
jgi:hypothetical protein